MRAGVVHHLIHLEIYAEYLLIPCMQLLHLPFSNPRFKFPFEYGKRPKEISSLTVNFTFIEFDCFKIEILRASSLSFDLLISSPSIVMIPSSFAMSLLTIEINVLLPAPFGPINDVIFPFGIVNDTSSITFLLL